VGGTPADNDFMNHSDTEPLLSNVSSDISNNEKTPVCKFNTPNKLSKYNASCKNKFLGDSVNNDTPERIFKMIEFTNESISQLEDTSDEEHYIDQSNRDKNNSSNDNYSFSSKQWI
jgi:hypothetical protein